MSLKSEATKESISFFSGFIFKVCIEVELESIRKRQKLKGVLKGKIFVEKHIKAKISLNITYRKSLWQVLELLLQRPHMIVINMCIPNNMDKITWNKF